MPDAAAIVLAGGRSSRMGAPKAGLDWHGSPLLRRVTGIVARAVDGPVIVVRAPGQALPALAAGVELAEDATEGRGPLQGLAAGLAAVDGRARVAYVSSTDVPLLHPAFVRRVVAACAGGVDAAVPQVDGHRQPLAAAYRTGLLADVQALIAAQRMRPAFLFERCHTVFLDADSLLRDAALARLDPELASVSNLNERADYERALELPAPEIGVERFGTLAPRTGPRRHIARGWSLGAVADEIGVTLDEHVIAALNGDQISRDPQLPLAAGDALAFMAADAGG